MWCFRQHPVLISHTLSHLKPGFLILFSHLVVSNSVTLWIIAHQTPLSMVFFRREYGVGCHFVLQKLTLRRISSLPAFLWGFYIKWIEKLKAQHADIPFLGGCCATAKSCLTLCDPMDCSKSCLPVPHSLPEFAQVHDHWVRDTVQPSHPLSPPPSFAFNLS